MSLKTICILALIFAVAYGVYFLWIVFKYRADEDDDSGQPTKPTPIDPNDD